MEQLSQTARGLSGTYESGMTKEKVLKELERVKWFLWHGNLFRADETLTDLMFEVDGAIDEDREARRPAHLVLKKWRLRFRRRITNRMQSDECGYRKPMANSGRWASRHCGIGFA
jgi:hypothetical protein